MSEQIHHWILISSIVMGWLLSAGTAVYTVSRTEALYGERINHLEEQVNDHEQRIRALTQDQNKIDVLINQVSRLRSDVNWLRNRLGSP